MRKKGKKTNTDQSGIAIASIDRDGTILYINKQFSILFSDTKKKLVGTNIKEPADHDPTWQMISAACSLACHGNPVTQHVKLFPGNTEQFVTTAEPVTDKKGEIHSILLLIYKQNPPQSAYDELQLRDEEIRNLHDMNNSMIAVIDHDFIIKRVNQNVLDFFDKKESDIIGKPCYKIFHQSNEPLEFCPLLQAKTSFSVESIHYYDDSLDKTFSITCTPVKDNSGTIIEFVDVIQDITKLKKYEFELQKHNTLLSAINTTLEQTNLKLQTEKIEKQSILDSLSDPLVYQGLDHKICWVNKAAADMADSTAEEMIGEYCYKLWHNLDIPCDDCPVTKAVSNKKIHTGEMVTPDNKIWYIKGHPVADSNGEIIGIVEIGKDITNNIKIENSLKEKEALFRSMFELAAVGICQVSKKGFFIHVNSTFCEITGYSSDELVLMNFRDITHPDDIEREDRIINDSIKSNIDSFNLTKQYIHKKGHIIWVKVYCSIVRDESGKIMYSVAAVTDITEQRNYEENLQREKKKSEESDRLKSAFLANLSHEIRTPMNGIIGFAQLLNDENINFEKRVQYIDTIQDCSTQLLKIVNDILEISKIETGQLEAHTDRTDINELINKLDLMYRAKCEKKGLYFDIRIPDLHKPAIYFTDSTKLKQILHNLINNAIEYTDKGGITLGYTIDNEIIHFTIKDSGPGIEPELMPIIFKRFIKGNSLSGKNGTGLGLSICKAYTELLKGEIYVESEKGKGTTFNVIIPMKCINESPLKRSKTSNPVTLTSKNILVVEDEYVNSYFIETVLKKHNHVPILVSTGEEAIAMIKDMPHISLVLMDIKLPGIDGTEAAFAIKNIRPKLPVIAQTAYAFAEEKQFFLNGVFDDYIAKPLNIPDLLHIINRHLPS